MPCQGPRWNAGWRGFRVVVGLLVGSQTRLATQVGSWGQGWR